MAASTHPAIALTETIDERDPKYEEAAAEAFNSSACVMLALQMPDVRPEVIASIYKAGFSDGSVFTMRTIGDKMDRVLTLLACGTKQ